MGFSDQAARFGREPCTIVEMDLDYCSLIYGTAPCVGTVGVTGSDRCFNTRKTCQDPLHFTKSITTYRFSNIEINDPAAMVGGVPCLPLLASVASAPCVLDIGKSIGVRASITVTFRDATYDDTNVDKYASLRAYNPAKRGTFWGKLRARNLYYQGRALRVRTGYLVDGKYDAANFRTRVYVISTMSGPDNSDTFTVVAKDILSLADNTAAQAPLQLDGQLLADLGFADLTATLAPTGIGNAEYAASGTLLIGSECITFTRVGDVLTFINRATDGTTQATHNAKEPVLVCRRWTDQQVHEIIYDLLINDCGVDPSFINFSDWAAECNTWLGGRYLSRLLVKPTGVKTLLDELCQQGLVGIWWDEINSLIRLQAVRPPRPSETTNVDETYNILEGSVTVADDDTQRTSEVWLYYGLRDPTLDDSPKNYSRVFIQADADAESPQEYNKTQIKAIYCHWLQIDDSSQANLIAFRILNRYRDNLVTISISLDAKDSALWTGSAIEVTARQLPDPSGAALAQLFQIVQAQEQGDGSTLNYQALLSNLAGRYAYITENSMVPYISATDSQRQNNGFISDNTPLMPDGTTPYLMV